MSRAEWDALEWWEQRLYREGLYEEFGTDQPGNTDQPGTTTETTVLSGDPGEFAALGFREMTL